MTPARILTVEDDAAIRRGIVDALTFAGYEVIQAAEGNEGARAAVSREFDLLLLDMVLPGKSGLEILREVRNARPTLPVIILSARGEERDRVAGLKGGADDYVVKPFSVDELLARVEAVLRRSPGRPTDVRELPIQGGCVDFARCEVRFEDGGREELSDRERELLRYFACHAGRAVGRDELLANVWQIDARGVTTRTIDMHVARLREKLRDTDGAGRVLVTVRGKGYMLARNDE
jgi:DNA-binding response OmpR family regulator